MLLADPGHAPSVRKQFLAGPTRRLALILSLFLATGAIVSACRDQAPTAAFKHVGVRPRGVCVLPCSVCPSCTAASVGVTWGCGADSQPVRTTQVDCSVKFPDSLALVIVRRSATPIDTLMRWKIVDSVNITGPPGSSYDWKGMALVPTVVTFDVQITANNVTLPLISLSTGFSPKSRPDWGKLDMDSSADVETVGYDSKGYMKRSTSASVTLSTGEFSGNAFADSTVYAASDSSGPNRLLSYMMKPGHLPTWQVNINPFLYAAPNPPVTTNDIPYYNLWYAAQDGGIAADSVHFHCTHAELTAAIPTLERHEGLSRMPNSHYGVADTIVRNPPGLQFDSVLEGLVRDNSSYSQTLFLAEDDTLRHFLRYQTGTLFDVRQQAFDDADSPNIHAALNQCVPHAPNTP